MTKRLSSIPQVSANLLHARKSASCTPGLQGGHQRLYRGDRFAAHPSQSESDRRVSRSKLWNFQLSEQLNLQARAELYLRRAAARTAAQDWQGVLGDVSWLKKNTNPVALAFELEGIAWDNLRNNTEAATATSKRRPATDFKALRGF